MSDPKRAFSLCRAILSDAVARIEEEFPDPADTQSACIAMFGYMDGARAAIYELSACDHTSMSLCSRHRLHTQAAVLAFGETIIHHEEQEGKDHE